MAMEQGESYRRTLLLVCLSVYLSTRPSVIRPRPLGRPTRQLLLPSLLLILASGLIKEELDDSKPHSACPHVQRALV